MIASRLRELDQQAARAPWEGRSPDLTQPPNVPSISVWAHGFCLFADEYRYAREDDAGAIVVLRNALPALANVVEAAELTTRTVPGVLENRQAQDDLTIALAELAEALA